MANEITKVTDQNGVDHPFKDVAAFPRSEQAVLGAKNLFDYLHTTILDQHVTHNFITNGIHVISSEAGNWSNVAYVIPNNFPNTDMIFSCVLDFVSGVTTIALKANDSAIAGGDLLTQQTYTEDANVKLSFNTGNKKYVILQFLVTNGNGGTGELSATEMMVSLSGGNYVPFAMSNKELTEKEIYTVLSSSDNLNDITKVGKYIVTSAPTNSPESKGYYTLLVFPVAADDMSILQIALHGENAIYYRRYSGSPLSWKPWVKVEGITIS